MSLVYRPEGEVEEVTDESKAEIVKQNAKRAFKLIYNLKTIPGVDEEGNIDSEKLNSWIKEVREQAKEAKRLTVADAMIGQMLAQYPMNTESYPPDEICEVIEDLNTKSLKNNYHTGLTNKRGVTTRGAFDGGDLERQEAEKYESHAENLKFKYPVVAKIFSDIANSYMMEAKRMDEEAQRSKLDY